MIKTTICGIYKIISPTNKVYIGESIDIEYRKGIYKNKHCKNQPKLYRSLKKHGWEAHIFEVIEECNREDLLCRERYWQDFYDVLNGGLNCKLTACGEKKQKLSEEAINRIKESKKGKNTGENNTMFGKKHSEESKKKMRDAKLGENSYHWGKNLPEATRNLLSDIAINKSKNGNYHSSKKVIDTSTGEVYTSIHEVSEVFKINYQNLANALKGKTKNKTKFKIL